MTDFKPSRATASIVGTVGSVQSKFDGAQTEVSIAVGKGYKDKTTQEWVDKGTDWYTFITRGDYQGPIQDLGLTAGDRVEVTDAKLEQRLFLKNDGQPGVSNDLNFGDLVVLERKADRAASGGGGGGGFGSEAPGGFI